MEEILSIRLSCNHCHASLSIPIGVKEYAPGECPYCNEKWFQKESNDRKAIARLQEGLSILRSRSSEADCHIQLEIEQPDL